MALYVPGSQHGLLQEARIMATRGYDIFTRHEATPKKIAELVKDRKSFKITQIGADLFEFSQKVEEIIETAGYTCRLYTASRAASMAFGFIPNPITRCISMFSALFLAAHNLATRDPDYEISRHLWDSMITVSYQRGYDG